MALTVTLGGNPLACDYSDFKSIKIEEGAGAHGDSASISFYVPSASYGTFTKPVPGQILRITLNGSTEFEGPVSAVRETSMNPEVFLFECSAEDYTHFLDRHLVKRDVYLEQTAGSMLRNLLTDWAPTFATDFSYIQEGLDVPDQQFDYEDVTSAITRLADQSLMVWYVDFNRKLHFISSESNPAPIAAINIDTEMLVGDIETNEDYTQIKNRVYMKGHKVRGAASKTVKTTFDENQSFFKINDEPWSLADTNISVAGEPTTRELLKDPLDGSDQSVEGAPNQAYVCFFNLGIRFPLADLPEPGQLINVEYHPVIPDQIIMMEDLDSQALMRAREGAGSDGIYEFLYPTDEFRVENNTIIEDLGIALLDLHAWPVISGSFKTYETGWQSGQTFTLFSFNRDIYDIKTYARTSTKVPLRCYTQSVSKEILAPQGDSKILTTVSFTSLRRPL